MNKKPSIIENNLTSMMTLSEKETPGKKERQNAERNFFGRQTLGSK